MNFVQSGERLNRNLIIFTLLFFVPLQFEAVPADIFLFFLFNLKIEVFFDYPADIEKIGRYIAKSMTSTIAPTVTIRIGSSNPSNEEINSSTLRA